MFVVGKQVNLVKFDTDFSRFSFKQLIEYCKMLTSLRQEIVILAEAVGCDKEFGNNLNLELAVKKKNSHLDMIYLSKKIQADYHQVLDNFITWLEEEDSDFVFED